MQVFKFGGASINSIERIKNVAEILKGYAGEPVMLIISAMGKTTNALEKVAEAFFDGRKEDALNLFTQVKNQHLTTAKYVLVTHYNPCYDQLNDFFTEAEWLLHDNPVRDYDYYYDQLVCIGELLSTTIMSHFLNETGVANTWLDVRDIFRTDSNFREANIDWEYTKNKVDTEVRPIFQSANIVLTQGFIGSTSENESTTLGREGSDYTAAIFANLLDASNQTIWKDVPSVMNADPKLFPNAVEIPELNYEEVIEMAYYGAQVIHPKTIKPLFEKKIPLLVKCFLDTSLPGTIISNKKIKQLPPIIVRKNKQVLISFHSKDYSFAGERSVGQLYHLLEELNMKPNLTQNGAITFMALFDDREDKVQQLALQADGIFDVQLERDLSLLTIRHYTEAVLQELTGDISPVLTQRTGETVQVIYRG